jgi:osmoprotectant transport system ATP-binding protein
MGVPVVRDVSLTVQQGELVILLGPSGCGKTTLLKMVNRLIEPSSGTIFIDDQDIRIMNPSQLRRQIGYVIQQVGLFPHMTVAKNIAVVPELLAWPAVRIHQRVDELLALVGLPPEEYRQRYPAQLSGGQQQRVGVARALASDPKVILMDEPFGAIDAITRSRLQDELLRLHQRLQKTILFVTHDVEEALCLANRIAVMRQGEIVQYDTPFQILTHPADEFVYELIGANDVLRQLGQIPIRRAIHQLDKSDFLQESLPAIDANASLRDALSELLRTGASQLQVTEAGRPVGSLSLEAIRAAVALPGSENGTRV